MTVTEVPGSIPACCQPHGWGHPPGGGKRGGGHPSPETGWSVPGCHAEGREGLPPGSGPVPSWSPLVLPPHQLKGTGTSAHWIHGWRDGSELAGGEEATGPSRGPPAAGLRKEASWGSAERPQFNLSLGRAAVFVSGRVPQYPGHIYTKNVPVVSLKLIFDGTACVLSGTPGRTVAPAQPAGGVQAGSAPP